MLTMRQFVYWWERIMASANIAIIGLGKVGTFFLDQLIQRSNLGLNIVCAVELWETEGKKEAEENGIAIVGLDDVIEFGDDVDFIFNLTGDSSVQGQLREKLAEKGNQHTELVSDHVLKVIWSMMTDEPISV